MVALEAIADNARLTIETYLGQSIGLGLNLADLGQEALGQAAVLFERPDGSYSQYGIEFSPTAKPQLPEEMIGFECGLDYAPPYELILPDLAIRSIQAVADRFRAKHTDFIETAIFFRNQWTLTRQRSGEILIDDMGTGAGDYLVVEEDELLFKYDIAM